jgi:hypothetical protein
MLSSPTFVVTLGEFIGFSEGNLILYLILYYLPLQSVITIDLDLLNWFD